MKTGILSSRLACLGFVFGMTAGMPLKAAVVGSSADNGDGTYTYSYQIDNTGGSFDSIGFSLDFDFTSIFIDWDQFDTFSGGSVNVPNANWLAQAGIPVTGLSAQDFLSIDPAGDVLIGSTLGGFSFISALAPGDVSIYEFGASGESSSGLTVGPTAAAGVPEGGNTLGYLLAASALVVSGRKFRRSV
jgi:hypothetical protein